MSDDNIKKFGISITGKAFDILSNKLYSRKVEALIREVSCNAKDGQDLVDPTIPIKIKLPTYNDPIFYVEDDGISIAPEKFPMVCTYFASDKTNNDNQIGGFGLGFKVPFCLVDSFVAEIRYDGYLRSYMCFKGDNGEPDYTELSCTKTDKRNGVKIQLAIPEANISEFVPNARKIFQYWDLKPQFINTDPFKDFTPKQIKDFDNFSIQESNKNEFVVLVGPVAYALDLNDIPNIQDKLQNIFYKLKHKFILKFNVGEITVSPTRENLDFDVRNISEKSTHKVLIKRLNDIIDEIEHNGKILLSRINTPKQLITEMNNDDNFYLISLSEINKSYFDKLFITNFSDSYKSIIVHSNDFDYWDFHLVDKRNFIPSKWDRNVKISPTSKIVLHDQKVSRNNIFDELGRYVSISLKTEAKNKLKTNPLLEKVFDEEFEKIEEYLKGFDIQIASTFKKIVPRKKQEKFMFRRYGKYGLDSYEMELNEDEVYNVWVMKKDGIQINGKSMYVDIIHKLHSAKIISSSDLFISETNYNRLSKKYKFKNVGSDILLNFSHLFSNELKEKLHRNDQFYKFINWFYTLGVSNYDSFKKTMRNNDKWNNLFIERPIFTQDEIAISNVINNLSIDFSIECDLENTYKEFLEKYPLTNILLGKWIEIINNENMLRDFKKYYE